MIQITSQYVEQFIEGFKEAAVWQAVDSDGEPLEGYTLSQAAEEKTSLWCREFIDANRVDLIQLAVGGGQAGHWFALSANRHGVGFFDHGGELAHRLQQASHPYVYNVWIDEQGFLSVE